MEYLGGGEVKWVNSYNQPIQTVDQTRRIIRDVLLGLEYRELFLNLSMHDTSHVAVVHYQGIIHRDIKPANLLWTADRSKVKISDFGVSHFSYAQRLAAAGKSGDIDNPHDPILLDDSDLSKTAGTPSFLAPEVVFDSSTETSPLNSVSNTISSSDIEGQFASNTGIRRQPITKAIDIWALGVTLYCLLFGQVPFTSEGGNEWALYRVISTQDYTVPPTMGFDKVNTGGRYPHKRDFEGYIVIGLLNQLLQKDTRQRATLEQVKVCVLACAANTILTRSFPLVEEPMVYSRPVKSRAMASRNFPEQE
jgi:serine/threonine protein kinase